MTVRSMSRSAYYQDDLGTNSRNLALEKIKVVGSEEFLIKPGTLRHISDNGCDAVVDKSIGIRNLTALRMN